jgi:hypothetical protein
MREPIAGALGVRLGRGEGSRPNTRGPRASREAVQQFELVKSLLIAVLGMLMPIEILAVMKAFVSVMPLSSNGDVQKQPEAAFLRVVKTVVERFCRIGEFF